MSLNGKKDVVMRVIATPRFIKSLGRLDPCVEGRVLTKANKLGKDPYIDKALRGDLVGLFSLRVGNYRVIYWIDKNKDKVWLVGHRKRVYKRLR